MNLKLQTSIKPMEEFFQYDFTSNPISFPRIRRSSGAFIPYDGPRRNPAAGGGRNVSRRMMEFLRRSWRSSTEVRERGYTYRHMMNERMRREKQKQSYSTLRALLPHGTKNDKNTIVQVAAREVVELERRRRGLENQNRAMAARLAKQREEEEEEKSFKKIKLKVTNPSYSSSSGIDSMLKVLKCLRANGFKTKSIQSSFSNHEVSAVLDILLQGKELEEAKAAIHRSMTEEVER